MKSQETWREKRREFKKTRRTTNRAQSNVRGAGGQQGSKPMLSGIGMQLEGVVDSIKARL